MVISNQLQSAVFKNLKVTNTLQVGSGSRQATAFRLNFQMIYKTNAILGSTSRQRFSSVYETDKNVTWVVPKGYVVTGISMFPTDQETLDVLKNLPTTMTTTSDNSDVNTPCGEVALTVHRTTDVSSTMACNPTGSYVLADTTAYSTESGVVAATPYDELFQDSFRDYFQHFIVNGNKRPESAFITSVQNTTWNTIPYRQAVTAASYVPQAGAPCVFMDASRTIFGNMTTLQNDTGVYIDLSSMSSVVADGTWGIALGLVAEAGYDAVTGTTTWPALNMCVVVHCLFVDPN